MSTKKNQNIYLKILMSRSMHVGYIRHAQTRQEEEQGLVLLNQKHKFLTS